MQCTALRSYSWGAATQVTFVRLSFIFVQKHRAWMAFLMLRRAVIVASVLIGTTSVLGAPGSVNLLGATFDYRLLPFMVLSYFVISHAQFAPYSIQEDNSECASAVQRHATL